MDGYRMSEDEKKLQKEEKLERISEEIKRLNKLFVNIDIKTKKGVKSLIENAAFMTVTLEDLQDYINTHGCISEYQNGENQWGTKKSAEVEVYNTMIKNHSSIMKQLTDLMPEPKKKVEKKEDDLLKIIRRDASG